MLLLLGIAAYAQLFACDDTWFKTILAQFLQENFANLKRKPLKQYKLETLSCAVRNTWVPVSIPRRFSWFVCDSSAPGRACYVFVHSPWFSYSAWAFVARFFLLGLSQSGFSNSAWLGAFVARCFVIGRSQSGFSNSVWAYVARFFLLGLPQSGFSNLACQVELS